MNEEHFEPSGLVTCPLCLDPERVENMVGGVCLMCADDIAWSQNALRGAVIVPAPSTPEPSDWEPPMGTKCPNCGFSFRYDPSDTYRNHRCPAPSTPEPSGLRAKVEGLPSPDPTFPSGYYTADMVSRAAVLALLDRAAPSTEPAPVEGDADFDATATDYRRGSPQYATEPALDAALLHRAIVMTLPFEKWISPETAASIAAEYDRLAESQPSRSPFQHTDFGDGSDQL